MIQEDDCVGTTRSFNLAVVGAWLLITIFVVEGTNRVGDALDVGWLAGAGKILGLVFWLVPVAHCLTAGRCATVERILLGPMSVMVGVTYASIVWLRARLGPDRELFRGIAHLRAGRLEQAARAFDGHLKRKPQNLAGLAHATLCLMTSARHEEALAYLDAALRQNRSAEVLALRALVLSSVGATEDALSDIDAAIAQRPKNGAYHYYRAQALAGGGRVDEALEVLRGPARPAMCAASWYLLAVTLPAKGEEGDAADACRRALPLARAGRLLGPIPWTQLAEAWLLTYMGRLDQAESAIARSVARYPDDSAPPVVQALVYTLRGQTVDALRSLERTERKDPFLVVQAARNPRFAPLAAIPGFPALLERTTRDWEAHLYAIRHRPGIAPSGA